MQECENLKQSVECLYQNNKELQDINLHLYAENQRLAKGSDGHSNWAQKAKDLEVHNSQLLRELELMRVQLGQAPHYQALVADKDREITILSEQLQRILDSRDKLDYERDERDDHDDDTLSRTSQKLLSEELENLKLQNAELQGQADTLALQLAEKDALILDWKQKYLVLGSSTTAHADSHRDLATLQKQL